MDPFWNIYTFTYLLTCLLAPNTHGAHEKLKTPHQIATVIIRNVDLFK